MSNGETSSSGDHPDVDAEIAVLDRYSAAASDRESALCCPVDYDPQWLKVIPDEVIERDYGCGDPSRYVRSGDQVLDLGSGGGKICFIASQIVGSEGSVTGVDMTREMLDLSRSAAPKVAERVGFANVDFRRGHIQDLSLDMEAVEAWLAANPVRSLDDLEELEREKDRLRRESPLVEDASVDIVVSNCVLNLVRDSDKGALIREVFRVLRVGGRIAISDIVSDEPIPADLKSDPELWSGCISGAFEEEELLETLAAAGFYGIAIDKWESEPFAVVEGIEFRSVTVTARKGKEGPCLEANQAVIYRGPWKRVEDDDGHILERGERVAVCAKTFGLYNSEPYAGDIIGLEPHRPLAPDERGDFDCGRDARREPAETKGSDYRETRQPGQSCC